MATSNPTCPALVSAALVEGLDADVIADLLNDLAAASKRNAARIAQILPDPADRWDDLVSGGPEWAGGHGMLQHDADREYLSQLEDAAPAVVASRTRTFDDLVGDLRAVADLGIDDSFGSVNMTIATIADAFCPLLSDPAGSVDWDAVVDAVVDAAAGDGYGYFTFRFGGDYENAPVGAWLLALPDGPRAEACARLVDELPLTRQGELSGLAAWARSVSP